MGKLIEKLRSNPFVPFLGKKVLFLLVAIFLAMTFIFLLPHLMPSSPVDIMIGRIYGGETTAVGTSDVVSTIGGRGSIQALKEIYVEKFGIEDPLHVQYLDFWKRLFTMDFGKSYWRWPRPVSSLVVHALPWTMALILPVVPIGFVVGNWIGSRAAYRRGRLETALYYISMYLWRAPYYWIALIFMLVFGVKLGLFPLCGAYSYVWGGPVFSFDWFLDAIHHYILPLLSLVGIGIGGWAVGMRAMTLYEMESDYMQYSKQLGFSEGKLREYAERNAILPNFTWIPMTFKLLVSQTLLVEIVFGYPGIGTLMYNAVFAMDYPLIEASFVISILIVLVGNFVADIIYGKLDPRIGTGYVGEE